MPRTLTAGQARTFFTNLANALVPGSTFGLWVESTSKRNRFYFAAAVGDKNGFLEEKVMLFIFKPRMPENIPCNGLDSVLAKACPELMLRPNVFMTIDKIASLLNASADAVYLHALSAFKKKMAEVLSTWDRSSVWKNQVGLKDRHGSEPSLTSEMSSFDELLVWADLNNSSS